MNSQTPMNSEKGLASKFAGRSASLMVAGSSTGSQNSTRLPGQPAGHVLGKGHCCTGPTDCEGPPWVILLGMEVR